jgi:hypothetical protein
MILMRLLPLVAASDCVHSFSIEIRIFRIPVSL